MMITIHYLLKPTRRSLTFQPNAKPISGGTSAPPPVGASQA